MARVNANLSSATAEDLAGGGGSETYFTLVRRKFRKSMSGMIGLTMVLLLLFMALFANFLAPLDPRAAYGNFTPPTQVRFSNAEGEFSLRPHAIPIVETGEFDPITFQPLMGPDVSKAQKLSFFVKGYEYRILGVIPFNRHLFGHASGDPVHILGTDKLGRDILSRAIVGSRLSLMIALLVVALTTIIGTTVGIVSGYYGGKTDSWIQRVVELFLAFPELPLYLALVSIIPITIPSGLFIAFVIGVMTALRWAGMSREVRGKTLSMARLEYVKAAISVGASDKRIIFRHILPNVLSHVIVVITLLLPQVVLLESFLGFLGFAVKPPLVSWGLMLQDTGNFATLGSYPWVLAPVGFVLLTVFAFNALGDGLRDSVDPY